MKYDPGSVSDLKVAPDPKFWLDTLRVAKYNELINQSAPDQLRTAFEAAWPSKGERAMAERVLMEHDHSPNALLTLQLLALFVEDKMGDVIHDVARIHLGDELVSNHPAFVGRLQRRLAALLLFQRDPHTLWDIDLWDLWHLRRRCSFDLVGRRGDAQVDLNRNWRELAEGALKESDAQNRTPVFCRSIFRHWENDVLLAFRYVGPLDTLRDPDGRVKTGHRDDWTFVRFYGDLNRLDIVSDDLDQSEKLASALASKVAKRECRYVHARDPLTRKRLDDFLRILCDPGDDRFRLREISAEVPGRWHNPTIRVSNTGKERVEQVVKDLQETYAFAKRSKDVRVAKVGFQNRGREYRIELIFPDPKEGEGDEEEVILSYSDHSGHKDVATRFEALVRETIGVSIHPRGTRGTRRRTTQPPKPKTKGENYWGKLLEPRIDDPADWQMDDLRMLQDQGVIRFEESVVFWCGDPLIPYHVRPAGSEDCPGTVEMRYAPVTMAEPFAQRLDEEFSCDTCESLWRVNRFKPPARHRVKIEVLPKGAANYIHSLLEKSKQTCDRIGEGLWTRKRRANFDCIVFVGLADKPWLSPDVSKLHPVCWVGVSEADVQEYGKRGVYLARLLTQKLKLINSVLALGCEAGETKDARSDAGELQEQNSNPQTSETGVEGGFVDDDRFAIVANATSITFRGREIATLRNQRTWLLFAMLQHFAHEDAVRAKGGSRRRRSAQTFTALDQRGRIEVSDLHVWTSRSRALINAKFPDEGLGEQIIETAPEGIRLGATFTCRGFSLETELQKLTEINKGKSSSSDDDDP